MNFKTIQFNRIPLIRIELESINNSICVEITGIIISVGMKYGFLNSV